MSHNSQYNITNEQLLLINILNGMYNDNLRQINNMNDSIYSLNESNRQIRNLLIQILNNNHNNNNHHNNNNYNNHNRRNNLRHYQRSDLSGNSNLSSGGRRGLGRVYLNNRPYIIDNLQHYNIPLNRENVNNDLSQILQNFFQPVEVFPTQMQIESATRYVRYCDIVTPRNRSCPISLENFNDNDMVSVIRYCGHIFNTEQLNTWFRSNCRCPVCRYDIRRYNSTASSEFFNANETTTSTVHSIPDVNPSHSTQSNSLNDVVNNTLNSTEERNIGATSGRTNNALLFFNSIIDTFSNTNDINLSNIETIGGFGELFTDLSGNNTSDVIYNLLNEFNNRTTR